jgi:hypothetical protein
VTLFELAGFSVVKPSVRELTSLGPDPRVVERFFPEEKLDAEGYSRCWFLKQQDDIKTGYIGQEQWSEKEHEPRQESAADKTTVNMWMRF